RKVDEISFNQHKEKLKDVSDKIINQDLTLDKAVEKYLIELSTIFNTSDNKLIRKNLIQSIYDPSVNKQFNQFLMNEISFEQWQVLSRQREENYTLIEKTRQVIELVHAIYDTPQLIGNLSEISKSRLSVFFDENNQNTLSQVLLNAISTFEHYKEIINKLERIITISNKDEEFSTLSPIEAFEKINQLKENINFSTNGENIDNKDIVKINNLSIDKKILSYLGVKINGESIDNVDISQIDDLEKKITF
ncbi:hypothetical protein AB7500_21175, partial [Providencia rettgeri]